MAGNQFGFNFSSDDDVEEQVFDTVIQRVEDYLIEHKLEPKDIVYIQVSFRQKDKNINLSLAFFSKIPLSKLRILSRFLSTLSNLELIDAFFILPP